MHRSCAAGVLVWLWAATGQAAAPEAPALPDIVDEPAAPVEPEPTEPPAEPTPEPAPEPAPEPLDETTPTDAPTPEPTEPPTTSPPFEPPATASTPTAAPPPAPPPSTSAPTRTAATPPASAPATGSSKTAPTADDASEPPDEKDAKDANKRKGKDDDDGAGEDEEKAEPIKHKGFIVDFRVGVVGCTRLLCKRHDAKPGIRLDGMLGRNFFGIVDLGLAGAWGRMRANVAPGTDGLSLYGLDRSMLPAEAAALNFDQFTVNDAHLETVQSGLNLRVHVIPRGRFDPYVGVGLQYTLLRAVYDTPGGVTRLGFHGLAFPLQGGFVVFAHKNIALGAQFDYLVTWYGGITVRGAPGRLGAPIPLIKDQAAMAGVNLPGDLPQLWTLGGVVHIRLGK